MRRKLLATSLAAAGLLFNAGANASDMEFLDLSKVDRDLLRSMQSPSPAKSVGTERELSVRQGPVRAVAGLDLDAKKILDLVKPNNDIAIGPKLFVLPVAGKSTEFAIVDVVWDAAFQTYHIAAVSTTEPGDYIRLSIDDDGHSLVGTAHQGEDVYRIVPYIDGKSLAVFDIDHQKQSASQLMNNRTDAERTKAERRHVQLAEIADLQPREFITSKDGRLSHIMDDDLGKMDLTGIGRLGEADPSAVLALASRFLKEHSALTGIHEEVDLQLQYVTSGDPKTGERAVISLDQSINGIPVEGAGYDFTIEPSTGTVVAMGRTLATGDNISTDPTGWYSQEEARQLAQREVNALSPSFGALKISKAELLYRWVGENNVEPFWRFTLEGGAYIIQVNALDGSISINTGWLNFFHQVCRPTSKGDPLPNCEDWEDDSAIILSEPSNSTQSPCVYYDPTVCQDPYYRHLYDLTQEIEEAWEVQFGNDCCTAMGSVPYDIIMDSEYRMENCIPNWPTTNCDGDGPRYSFGEQTIHYPYPADDPDDDIWEPGVYPTGIFHVHIHEMFHAYEHKYGPNLTAYTLNGDPIANSVNEGLADVAAAVFTDPPNWKIGDNEVKQLHRRDLSIPRSINDFRLGDNEQHFNGTIWGHLFYKVSTKPGVTLANLRKLLAKTVRRMNSGRDGNSGQYSFKDIEVSIKLAAGDIGDASIQNAVNAVWIEIGGGQSSSAPDSPYTVNGVFSYCSTNVSHYYNSWDAVAPFYQVFWSPNFSTWYFEGSVSTTVVVSENTADGYVKVKGCNSSGCSPLSPGSFFQEHVCGG